MRNVLGMALGLALVASGSAQAQDVPVEVSTLAGQEVTLHLYPFLTESDLLTLRLVATNKQALQLFITTKGYSAIAVAPDEGFAPGGAPAPSAMAIGDFSDAAAAAVAATKGCDDKRKGGEPCVVVLEVGPAR